MPRGLRRQVHAVHEIGHLERALGRLARVVGFDGEATHGLCLALREAVANAIRHGQSRGKTAGVTVELLPRCGELEMRVRDRGPGFDPSRLPDPHANLLATHGRGLLLMRALTDRVSFSFPPEGGTVVTLVKRLP